MPKIEKNWLEWTVFGLSLALVIGVLGYLIYWEATSTDRPPNIRIELGDAERRGEHFYVPVTLHNEGDKTAEGVHVVVTLKTGETTEEGEFEVAFLPHHSRREGTVAFKTNPAESTELTARITGYQKP